MKKQLVTLYETSNSTSPSDSHIQPWIPAKKNDTCAKSGTRAVQNLAFLHAIHYDAGLKQQ